MLRPLSLTFFARSAISCSGALLLGRRADDLLQQHGHADAAAAGGVEAVLYGDVVVRHHRQHLGAGVGGGQFGGHLEVHHVAGVVLHDVQDTRTRVDRLGRGHHLVRHRRGEHLTGTRRVEHPGPDEPAVHRLVSRPTAGDQSHLARPRGVLAVHDPVFQIHPQPIRMRCRHPLQRLTHNITRFVDELLHATHLSTRPPGTGVPRSGRRRRRQRDRPDRSAHRERRSRDGDQNAQDADSALMAGLPRPGRRPDPDPVT